MDTKKVDAEPVAVAVPLPIDFDFDGVQQVGFDDIPAQVTSIPTRSPTLDKDQYEALADLGFSRGMAESLSESCSEFALRIWVVDNSGSMSQNDGHKMIKDKSRLSGHQSVPCSRWEEIQETINYHVDLAAHMKAPTRFRLLNEPGMLVGPQVFSIAENGEANIRNDLQVAKGTISAARPTGATPLVTHINEIREEVQALAPTLKQEGRRVAIILATDGLPTNPRGVPPGNERENFVAAMKSLEGLPVWVVIRLCTDTKRIVDYYNDLDRQLELSIEVLDDYTDEALEMYGPNPWLNYTVQLHRMREMGFQKRYFDYLDERPLTLIELYEFCVMLFGESNFADVPTAEQNFKEFCKAVKIMAKKEAPAFHPVRYVMKELVSVSKMKSVYGKIGIGGCILM